jgi:hypothetical protein
VRSLMWSIAGGMLVAAVAPSALGSAAGATDAPTATCGKGTVAAVLALLKGFDSSSITLPRASALRPDRERLAERFERFLERAR